MSHAATMPMSPLPIVAHATAEALADAVAEALAHVIREGIAARGEAWLALAGGSTPFAAYRRLAAMALPWSQVHLVASDERWVPATHEKRNERALAEAFAAANGVTIHPLVPAVGRPSRPPGPAPPRRPASRRSPTARSTPCCSAWAPMPTSPRCSRRSRRPPPSMPATARPLSR